MEGVSASQECPGKGVDILPEDPKGGYAEITLDRMPCQLCSHLGTAQSERLTLASQALGKPTGPEGP